MNVDIQSLGTFNRMTHEGAERAADSLSRMTGIDTFVETTKLNVTTVGDVRSDFDDEESVGVDIGFEGKLHGRTILSFDRESAHAVTDVLAPNASTDEFDGMNRSAIEEVGNILTSGFIDGWADYFGGTIDISTPQFVEGQMSEILSTDEQAGPDDRHVFVLKSRVVAVDEEISFKLYMLPTPDSMESLLESEAGEDANEIAIEKLALFKQLARQSAATVSEDVTKMTGVETRVDITQLNFISTENIPNEVSDGKRVGVVLEFDGSPSGYIIILFDEPSAHSIAAELVPDAGEEEGESEGEQNSEGESFSTLRRSAIREIGSIITCGFIDSWANVLETTIDISTPQYVHDMGKAIVDPIAIELGRNQEFVFSFDATIRASNREFDCGIYALPDETELRHTLESIDAERIDESAVGVDCLSSQS